MPDTLTIPAALVRPVAEAAELLGRATDSILRRMESPDRRAEMFEGPFGQFDSMRDLLEALGPIDAGRAVALADEHAPALADALRAAGPLLIALAHAAHDEGDTEQAREYTSELVARTEYAGRGWRRAL